jgi:hypothetical protein
VNFVIDGCSARMEQPMTRVQPAGLAFSLVLAAACSEKSPGSPALGFDMPGAGSGGSGGSSGSGLGGAPASGAGGLGASAGGPTISLGGSTGGFDVGAAGSSVCATVTAEATLEPVFLAFAFDVSGSMGKGDYPWHDASLKWEPVVAATRAFFEDAASTGLSGSLTAFPIDADEDERCDPESYDEPDVAMTELPSSVFGEALDAIREEDWRGGTPTLAVVEGVLAYLEDYRADHPGHYAFVLVTDGHPQDCDDDSIESVENAVASVAAEIQTYVIGVKNPPLTDEDGEMAPDTVSNLAGVAQAGGTGDAFMIDTGDPVATSAAFQAAVGAIRGVAVACNLDVPAPPDGRKFEKENVLVSYTSSGTAMPLTYDPDCALPGAWHYDDLDQPTQVILCPSTCATVEGDSSAELSVGFTCEPVIKLPR